ncbi:hypothetical protein AAMO2058_000001700 [Amorphochlora amoebiformis]
MKPMASPVAPRALCGLEALFNTTRCGNLVCKSTSSRWTPTIYQLKPHVLCAVCYPYFKAGRCCKYCQQIHRQGDKDGFDGKKWVECSLCLGRSHVSCEQRNGLSVAEDLYQMATETRGGLEHMFFLCITCRKKARKEKDYAFDLFCLEIRRAMEFAASRKHREATAVAAPMVITQSQAEPKPEHIETPALEMKRNNHISANSNSSSRNRTPEDLVSAFLRKDLTVSSTSNPAPTPISPAPVSLEGLEATKNSRKRPLQAFIETITPPASQSGQSLQILARLLNGSHHFSGAGGKGERKEDRGMEVESKITVPGGGVMLITPQTQKTKKIQNRDIKRARRILCLGTPQVQITDALGH